MGRTHRPRRSRQGHPMSTADDMAATLANRRPDLAAELRAIHAQNGPEAVAWQRRANANFARLVSESTPVDGGTLWEGDKMNAALQPSELEQWCAELRTADGIKRQLMRTDNSRSTQQMLVDLLYAAGRLDGLRDATDRVSV